MRKSKILLSEFLEMAKSHNNNKELTRVLKAQAYRIDNANVLIRVASGNNRRYFFGLNYITAEEMYNLSNSFIAFVCGNLTRIVFFPIKDLIKLLPEISHDRNGEYKLNFTRSLNLVLKGRNNQYKCSTFINNWDSIHSTTFTKANYIDPIESLHTVIQGRLIDIGNIRGYKTYSPDKSKKFNKKKLVTYTTLKKCPELQFTEYKSLRYIDVLWFRKTNHEFYPEYAFEVEFSTGVWSGVGRLSTLREYNTKLFVISFNDKKYNQVMNSFPNMQERISFIIPDKIGMLYSAEKNLIEMRRDFKI